MSDKPAPKPPRKTVSVKGFKVSAPTLGQTPAPKKDDK